MNDIDLTILKMIDDYCQISKEEKMKETLKLIEIELIKDFITILKERDNNE